MRQPPHPDSEISLFVIADYSFVASWVVSRYVEPTHRLLTRVLHICWLMLLLRFADTPNGLILLVQLFFQLRLVLAA